MYFVSAVVFTPVKCKTVVSSAVVRCLECYIYMLQDSLQDYGRKKGWCPYFLARYSVCVFCSVKFGAFCFVVILLPRARSYDNFCVVIWKTARSMAWFTSSPAGWLPVHRDQLRAQRSVTSMGKLYLYLYYGRQFLLSMNTVFPLCYRPVKILIYSSDQEGTAINCQQSPINRIISLVSYIIFLTIFNYVQL